MSEPKPAPYWRKVDVMRPGNNSNIRTFEHVLPDGGVLVLVRSVVAEHVAQSIVHVPPAPPFQFNAPAGVYR